ncbi:MAG: DegV family protein [Coriobacteriaceae bacterium]|nr:DegV family protein [Coriobacteriaceae bacterium]MDD7430472.1 DegV family protein [Coriobacteriaceae bacterium]MDY3799961.1 DegV family protein [Eggerthellaceae bacterium]
MEAKCNLILDSCCDLPYQILDRPGVEVLRFPYIQEGVEYIDDMYSESTPKQFFAMMRDKKSGYPSTAQIPLPAIEGAFRRALESGVPTVYLGFSSGLSGTFETCRMLAENLSAEYPQGELHVVDTLLASVAEGLLVYEALNQREKGLTATEMVEWVKEARFFVNAQFMVDDLSALERGGRIPGNVAKAGAMLDVKPMLGFDLEGKLALTGVVRGRKKGIKQLISFYSKNHDTNHPVHQVITANADCPRDADKLCDGLKKDDESVFVLQSSVGPVIGSHVGPDMLAVVFWGHDRRNEISVADRIARKVKGI